MIISENYYNKENCVSFGELTIKKNNCEVVYADEHFYHYINKLVGINFEDVIHPDQLDDFKLTIENIRTGECVRMIMMLRNGQGEFFWADMYVSDNGKVLSGDAVIDIKAYFLSAIESRYILALDNMNKYRTMLSVYRNYLFDYDSSDGIFTIYLYRGNQNSSVVKQPFEEFRKHVLSLLENPRDRADFEQFCSNVLRGSHPFTNSISIPFDNSDELCRFKVMGDSVYATDKHFITAGYLEPIDGDVHDIIPYYAMREAVDPATGLLNKKACMEYTQSVIASDDNEPHYMVIFDIDNFKHINDTYGHLFGDEVIASVANILNASLNGRGIAGRFGGDEFYIFTSNIPTEDGLRVMLTSMRNKLKYAFEETAKDLNVTLSIGVSLYPQDDKDYDSLFKKADMCLYLAKQKGKNRYIIYDVDKHGEIDGSDDSNVNRMTDLSEHIENMCIRMSDVTVDLMKRGKTAVPDAIKVIVGSMHIDGLRIFDDYGNRDVLVIGNYKKIPNIYDYVMSDEFQCKYNSSNTYVVSNVPSIEAWNKPLFTELMDCDIMGFISMKFEFDGKWFYFFYDVFGHNGRWYDSDRSILLIVSRMIASLLR